MKHQTRQFFLCAKSAEIQALEQLADLCQLVGAICDLVHQLQRERGLTNIYLASAGDLFSQERRHQVEASDGAEQCGRELLALWFRRAAGAAPSRLLNSIALALQALDQLPLLRQQIASQRISPQLATAAYGRLIAAWLAMVLETAELSCDPPITRLLVAIFNLLQAKEYAGQERAWGAISLASARLDQEQAERLLLLQQAQAHSLGVFLQYADGAQQQAWQQQEQSDNSQQLARLRLMLQQLAHQPTTVPAISDLWYQCATIRMDAMHQIHCALVQQLQQQTGDSIALAQSQLEQQQSQADALTDDSSIDRDFDPQALNLLGADGWPATPLAPASQTPGWSFYQLLCDQAQQIRCIETELAEARQAINAQKLVNRAKRLLMANHGLSEERAYRLLQQQAMNSQKSLAEIAAELLAVACSD